MNNDNIGTTAPPAHCAAGPVQLVLMGVCGSGKTTVAEILADRLGLTVAEADDFHPQANIDKMASGHPLNDDDRWPWLATITEWMNERAAAGKSGIVTCSALKRSYRDVLRSAGAPVIFVHLDGERELIAARLNARTGHFMPPGLLDSQIDILEPLTGDEAGLRIDVGPKPQELASQIMRELAITGARNGAIVRAAR